MTTFFEALKAHVENSIQGEEADFKKTAAEVRAVADSLFFPHEIKIDFMCRVLGIPTPEPIPTIDCNVIINCGRARSPLIPLKES
jgi:hypothetical protein